MFADEKLYLGPYSKVVEGCLMAQFFFVICQLSSIFESMTALIGTQAMKRKMVSVNHFDPRSFINLK